jgi:hypothetical protein
VDIDEKWCACFPEWQNASDFVKWTTLMQNLKVSGIDWCDRRLIRKLYMDRRVKVNFDLWETRRVNFGGEVRQGCCFSSILFNVYSEYLTKAALEDLRRLQNWTSNSHCEICR